MKIVLLNLFILLFSSQISIAQQNKALSAKYFETASNLFDKEAYKEAILYCDSAITTNTDNLEAYAYRGVCKFQLKKYEEAIADFDLALTLNNGYAEVYYYRGLCKKELGADKQACEDWYNAYDLGFKQVMKIIKLNCKLEHKSIPKKKK